MESNSKRIQRSTNTCIHISTLEEKQPLATQTVTSFCYDLLRAHLFASDHQTPVQKLRRRRQSPTADAPAPSSLPSAPHSICRSRWNGELYTPAVPPSATANKSPLTAKCCLCAGSQSGLFDVPLFPRVRSPSRQLAETCKVSLRRLLTFQELLAPFRPTEEAVQRRLLQHRNPRVCLVTQFKSATTSYHLCITNYIRHHFYSL